MGRWLQKAPWSHLKCFVALCCLQSVNAFVRPAPAKALDRAGRTAGQEGVCRVEKDALRLLVPATTRISAPTVPLRKWLEGRVRTGSQSVVRLDMNSNALGVGAAGTAVTSVTTTMPLVPRVDSISARRGASATSRSISPACFAPRSRELSERRASYAAISSSKAARARAARWTAPRGSCRRHPPRTGGPRTHWPCPRHRAPSATCSCASQCPRRAP